MLTAEKVKEQLTVEHITQLLCDEFGSPEPIHDNEGNPIFSTCVCHGGDSYKLYYYISTGCFYCYSHCGPIGDVFALVQHVKNIPFQEAFQFIVEYFHIKDTGFSVEVKLSDDWDLLQAAEDYVLTPRKEVAFIPISENLVSGFYPLAAPTEWMKEGISPEVMKYYNIRVDVALEKVIIPHRDVNGNIIGIRGRTYDPFELIDGKKYMPVRIEKDMYNHQLGKNLYGIYENKETIKRLKKVLICESEKSVLQCATMYGVDNCFAVAMCGSNFSVDQLQLLLDLGVEEIIFAPDRDYDVSYESGELVEYREKFYKQLEKALPYVNCYYIIDIEGILPLKASPTDCGKDILEKLMKKKVYVPSVKDMRLEKKRRT